MAQQSPSSPEDRRPRAASDGGGRMRRFGVVLWIVVAVAVLGAVVFLHVSGAIGPGTH